jgi:hypothetical protein
MGCGWKVLRTSAAFVGLVATAPSVAAPGANIAWLAAWVGFAALMVDTAATCDAR